MTNGNHNDIDRPEAKLESWENLREGLGDEKVDASPTPCRSPAGCCSPPDPYPYDPNDGRESLEGADLRVVRGGS